MKKVIDKWRDRVEMLIEAGNGLTAIGKGELRTLQECIKDIDAFFEGVAEEYWKDAPKAMLEKTNKACAEALAEKDEEIQACSYQLKHAEAQCEKLQTWKRVLREVAEVCSISTEAAIKIADAAVEESPF